MSPVQDPEAQHDASSKPMPYLPPAAARSEYYRDPRLKSPITATVLSIVPGVGQVYLGYTQLGFIHGATAATFICLMSTNRLGLLEPFVGVLMAFFFLYNLVDAYRRALLLNEAASRMETPQLPDGFGAVSFGARIAGGVMLILIGMLTLLNLRFGISMEWLNRWWPAALVLMGLYLVIRAVKDRSAETQPTQD
jgi:hypothetical protein